MPTIPSSSPNSLWAQTVSSRTACFWLVLATMATTLTSSLADSLVMGLVSTVLLLIAVFTPWRFKIHGDTPWELLLLSKQFQPGLFALTLLAVFASLGSDNEALSAVSSMLLVCSAMLPIRRKIAAVVG